MLVMNMVVKYSKKKIIEKRVLEVSKRVRFVILTLSKCSLKPMYIPQDIMRFSIM